jgi:hypothetical protein
MHGEGSFPEGRGPYHERLAHYREFIERRAWLVALVVPILCEPVLIGAERMSTQAALATPRL